jgi:hypothetical protein
MNTKTNSHFGKKILYSLVIGMSGLILLLGVAGIIGVWVVERPMSDAAVTLLSVVEKSTVAIRTSISKADQTLAELEAKTAEISDASNKIRQNVDDKGLVLTLLPEEKEKQFVETVNSARDTYTGIRASIAEGLDLYRSINRIPFVSLPGLSDDQMDKVENSMTQIQVLVETLRSGMADLRSGVAGTIDKVVGAANLLGDEINRIQDELAQIDSKLAALETFSIQMQQVIPGIFMAAAIVLTLVEVFLIFTQVEVIRLYLARWRNLGQPQVVSAAEPLPQTDEEETAGPEGE